MDVHPKLFVNGSQLICQHGCGMSWNPCFPEKNGERAKAVVQHYQLDSNAGWIMQRKSFAWKSKRKPKIKTISVTLAAGKTVIPGSRFCTQKAGGQVEFVHPVTGVQHTLMIEKYEPIQVQAAHWQDGAMEYPCCGMAMGYRVQPALSAERLQILDCAASDLPRSGHWNGIPGVLVSFEAGLCAAVSSLHYEPVTEIAWRMFFYEQLKSDIAVALINEKTDIAVKF